MMGTMMSQIAAEASRQAKAKGATPNKPMRASEVGKGAGRGSSGKKDATAARGASQRPEDRQGIGRGQTGAVSQKRKTQTLLAN
jgi:hypothetical protein